MQTYHFTTTVSKDGIPVLPKLPLREGEKVEVTIETKNGGPTKRAFPLRGLPHRYIDPFDPAVPSEDWNVLSNDPS